VIVAGRGGATPADGGVIASSVDLERAPAAKGDTSRPAKGGNL
jgi:hypothetical protein